MSEFPQRRKGKGARGAYKKNLQGPWIDAFRREGTIHKACELVKVDRWTILQWRKTDPEFEKAFNDASMDTTERLEDSALTRALGGDATLTIFLLKARDPRKYTERYRHEIESSQLENLIGLFSSIVKRVVPRELWPKMASEIENAARLCEVGEGTVQ